MANKVKKLETPNLSQTLTAELLGQAIKAKRTQTNLRLQDAADLCGIAKHTLMKLEHGHDSAQLSTVLKICSGLGIKLNISPWASNEEVSDEWQ